MSKNTLLIDSNFLCQRAKFIVKEHDKNTIGNALIYTVLSSILVLAEKFKTNDFLFIWDSKRSKRKKLYKTYKGQRRVNRTEEDIELDRICRPYFDILRQEILPTLGFNNHFIQAGYEGDDLIAKIIQENLGHFVMVTSDKDMYQCLYNAKFYSPIKQKIYTERDLMVEYGVTPQQWGMVKAIGGCISDNVKGCERVGEATAIKYILGNLKHTLKTFSAITSIEGKQTIETNKPLVILPFKGTKSCKFVANNFTVLGLVEVCTKYNFTDFMDNKLQRWKDLFAGVFTSKRYINKSEYQKDFYGKEDRIGCRRKGEKRTRRKRNDRK